MTSSRFAKIDAVADHFNVSVSTIRTWIRNKSIPRSTYLKVGNTYRFDISKIEKTLLEDNEEPITSTVPTDINIDDDI